MNSYNVQKWDALCLVIDIYPDEVGKKIFLLSNLGGYLFSITHGNKYILSDGK